MTINCATKNDFTFDEALYTNDCAADVVLFETWRAAHPKYQFEDGDQFGRTILMHAIKHGNVSLVNHLVKVVDTSVLNLCTQDGETLLDQFLDYKDSAVIHKIVECVKIIIEAGAYISGDEPPLQVLIDACHLFRRIGECALPLIKAYIRMEASCQGKILNSNSQEERIQSPFFRQAQEDILCWSKTRYVYLGGKEPGNLFSEIPSDLLGLIIQAYRALPDEADSPQDN